VHIRFMNLEKQDKTVAQSKLPLGIRAVSALGVSVIADALDYVGAPIFALPVIGDIADGIVMAMLYRLTGSKKSALIHAIEFIPFVGDYVPTYTITTIVWILRELRKRDTAKSPKQTATSPPMLENIQLARSTTSGHKATEDTGEDLPTRFMRAYAVLRSKSEKSA
jgi:hypothetical protein